MESYIIAGQCYVNSQLLLFYTAVPWNAVNWVFVAVNLTSCVFFFGLVLNPDTFPPNRCKQTLNGENVWSTFWAGFLQLCRATTWGLSPNRAAERDYCDIGDRTYFSTWIWWRTFFRDLGYWNRWVIFQLVGIHRQCETDNRLALCFDMRWF